MSQQPFSDEVAIRIGLAARVLSDVSIRDLILALQEQLGDELDEVALSRITVTKLKTAFGLVYSMDDEVAGENADNADIAALKKAVRILWGETEEEDLPPIQPYQEGDMGNSLRIAVASNQGEQLDAHFGSCLRFLIYQLSASELRLIDVRSTVLADVAEDRNGYRVNLIRDCPVLYVVAIGGPAAAKVVQANIYPMKIEEGGSAREILGKLQRAIAASPPPWVAKILGVDPRERVKNYKAADVQPVSPVSA